MCEAVLGLGTGFAGRRRVGLVVRCVLMVVMTIGLLEQRLVRMISRRFGSVEILGGRR